MTVMAALPWELRVSRLAAAIEHIGGRRADVRGDMVALRTEVTAGVDRIEDRLERLDTSMNALVSFSAWLPYDNPGWQYSAINYASQATNWARLCKNAQRIKT